MQQLLDSIVGVPAFVRNGRLDILAIYGLGRALYSAAYAQDAANVNLARFAFLDHRTHVLHPDWEKAASAGSRFAVRYSNAKTDDGDSNRMPNLNRMPDVRRAFNSPFWPFVLASTSVAQEESTFTGWAHSVIHWNVPGNGVDFEQREGRAHRYLGHAVRKNVAEAHGAGVLKPGVTDPWESLFAVAAADVAAHPENSNTEFAPHWIYPGDHKIQRKLLDHPLSRDVPRTKHMLAGLAKYRLTLGQARQDDLLGLIKEGTEIEPLNLRP